MPSGHKDVLGEQMALREGCLFYLSYGDYHT